MQVMGQGFQGHQEMQGYVEESKNSHQPEPSSLVEEIKEEPVIDEPDDFFEGLKSQTVASSNLGSAELSSSGNSQDALFTGEGDDFESQLDSTKGMRGMISAMNSQAKSDKEMEIQDLLQATEEENQDKERGTGPQQDLGEDGEFLDEPFEDDNFDRDPDNEEVYDYFLDANKEENQNENQGYHIID